MINPISSLLRLLNVGQKPATQNTKLPENLPDTFKKSTSTGSNWSDPFPYTGEVCWDTDTLRKFILAARPWHGELIIGREDNEGYYYYPDADIKIPSKNVSEKHASIRRDDGGRFYLKDLESTNGTFINRERLVAHEERLIQANDKIQFAKFPEFILF